MPNGTGQINKEGKASKPVVVEHLNAMINTLLEYALATDAGNTSAP
jgi:hypothetical protein